MSTPFLAKGPEAPDDRAESVFFQALKRPIEGREAFIDEACGADSSLRAEVEGLLRDHEKAGTFLKDDSSVSPELAAEFARLKPEEVGERIGPYKLLEQIGEGGFGTVWVAEQEKPIRRRVALKIIKLGMDTKEVIARFEQERQALAMMDHPNIAKVLDAGATAHGRPFFAMELVRGLKITDYCDDKQLSTRERIELFITVCQAVQHAHQKGIIHRDLKPSNILVTINDGKAVPKVIDFGVAKATQGRLVEQTVYTQFQQMIGTPLYMSPEQAELTSLDIDTRSDIYSLGVLLYELLTGHTPIDQNTLARLGMDEIRRIIREVDPPRPSLRMKTLAAVEMTTAAKRRNIEPAKLSGTLRDDLDWIVMKCIEKDRARRYDTANSLARDLERHLRNEVITARPPTAGYLLSRLIRRHKLTFAAGAAIALSLIIGIAASLWQAKRARDEGARARQAASQAKAAEERVTAALNELRATAPAYAEQARSLASRERFDEAIEKLDYAIKLHPEVAEYLVAKGDLLQCQFKLAAAAAIYREALRVEPGLARAETSARLCDELLAAKPGEQGKLTRESLAKLHLAMQQQQRPAAELIPVARLLGEEKKLLVEYWLARLKDLPVSAERPLKDRLTVRDDGRLALDLSGTKIVDLSPLAGAPLAVLDAAGASDLFNIDALHGMNLVELNLTGTKVEDLSPLREMRTLEKLLLNFTPVTDLSALQGLRLKHLDITRCIVRDISPLQSSPLEQLSLRWTRVTDLSPLAGMSLKELDLARVPVLDFKPLAGLPLEVCNFAGCQLSDLAVLRAMPLRELMLWNCSSARNYAVLGEIKTLELLILPETYRQLPDDELAAIAALRGHPRLRQLGSETPIGMDSSTIGSKDAFWKVFDREREFTASLRESGIKIREFKRLGDGTWEVNLEGSPIGDLTILSGAPISSLSLGGTAVSDLAPLHGMRLKRLKLWRTEVSDLAPLKGMPLDSLHVGETRVADLSPLRGMPLTDLRLHQCPDLTDLSPLADCRALEWLTPPPNARNLELLRTLPKLERISFNEDLNNGYRPDKTAAEFWQEYDTPWIARLRESGIKPRELKRLDDGTWEVNFDFSAAFTDLTNLSGAPISKLRLGGTAVSDLAPLRGMPLKLLIIWGTKVRDLTPLKGMPLDTLNVVDTKVTDLSPLRGMPLTNLNLRTCRALTDLSPLADCRALQGLTLPPNARNLELVRTFPKLELISFSEEPNFPHLPDKTAAEFWTEYDANPWIARLRESGIKFRELKRLDDGTWEVSLEDSAITDLTILSGAPISRLWLGATAVSDLTPLRGMPLKELYIWRTEVSDLTPLKGMPLERLHVGETKVADLSPLRGLPLTYLRLHQCPDLTDLSPLADCRALEWLTPPPNARNLELLRTFPNLERISFDEDGKNGNRPDKTAAEFWHEYDAKTK